jgi:hypothetical protein
METGLICYINDSELKPGEKYYIQDTESTNYWYLTFKRYSGSRKQYKWFTYLREPGSCKFNQTFQCYIKITQEKYLMKRREKYNQTCLDIVLKRLVDESFQW